MDKYFMSDYANAGNYIKQVNKSGLSNFPPLIITCAITGGNQGKEANMNLPETLEEQIEQATEAYEAGASMIHIHRRSGKNQAVMTDTYEEYVEVNAGIRKNCPDVIINDTAGGGRVLQNGKVSDMSITCLDAYPEVASFDTTNWASRRVIKKRLPPLTGRDEDMPVDRAYALTKGDADAFMNMINERDIKPEFECFDLGDFEYLRDFIARGMVKGPHFVQLVLSERFNYPTVDFMAMATRLVPEESLLSFIITGKPQFALAPVAIALGAHIRVGFEDNMYLEKGRPAKSNAEFVEKIVRIAKEMGRPIATPAQAREMMGLGAPRQYPYIPKK